MGIIDYLGRKPSRDKLLRGEIPAWIARSKRGKYISSVVLSAPPWVDLNRLRAMAAECRWVSEMSGIEHCLDHIVPLNHPKVCGLTVPWNLRIVPRKPNESKGNSWNPDQLHLFDESPLQMQPVSGAQRVQAGDPGVCLQEALQTLRI